MRDVKEKLYPTSNPQMNYLQFTISIPEKKLNKQQKPTIGGWFYRITIRVL